MLMLARDGLSVRSIALGLDGVELTRRWCWTTVERILKHDLHMREKPERIVDARLRAWRAARGRRARQVGRRRARDGPLGVAGRRRVLTDNLNA
jgi:hypothetical protein